jgi:two-component system cell cycle sensor histidine kinase/response regulator CckA
MVKRNILIVDDDANLCKTLSDIFRVKGYVPIAAVTGKAALSRAEEETPAVALIDLRLEDMSGLEVMGEIKKRSPGTECILLTGYASQASAIEAINLGVYSYVQKPYDIEQLLVTVHRAVEKRQVEEERAFLLTQIQEQAQQMKQTINTVPEGVLLLNGDRQIILANPTAKKDLSVLAGAKTGDTLTRLGNRPLAELLTSPPKGLWHEVEASGPPHRTFEVIARPIEAGPTPGGWVLVIRDVTQEREIQRRVQQKDRLAAVGQLATGIAHDFSNIMAVIVLYTEIALRAAPDLSPKTEGRLKTVIQQAKHASDLIQQILDFSQRAVIERQPLSLVPLLKEQIKLLERTLPENIQINLTHVGEADEYMVNADPTRMQQMVMNLALNARDAMPEGGELCIELEQIRIEYHKETPLPEMQTGEWVRMMVRDNGTGIPPDVLPHIFDPFFTTKAPGQGSGLGLPQVYGIVKQHEGEVDVKSQIGRGTTFSIYLPALSVHQPETTTETQALAQGSGETILVVEDDAVTREALVVTLETLHYRALGAANGREALAIFEKHTDAPSPTRPSLQAEGSSNSGLAQQQGVALVLSDAVMPEMDGIALFHALRQRCPEVPVVLLTGHPMEKEMEGLRAQGLKDWLPKPPNLDKLAQVVARALKEDKPV